MKDTNTHDNSRGTDTPGDGRDCGICGSAPAEELLIGDRDGATVAYGCDACIDQLIEGDNCAVCEHETSGEYQILFQAAEWNQTEHPVCSECRRRWTFGNTEHLSVRLERLGVSRFGGGRR